MRLARDNDRAPRSGSPLRSEPGLSPRTVYGFLTRPEPTTTITPGFHDANGDGFDDADEPDKDSGYLRSPIIGVFAPVSVPSLLVAAVFFTVASPVAR
jgi:hypothetical protein